MEVLKTGAVFWIAIVKIAELVVYSGRVPTILTSYEPRGLDFDTKIAPVAESTPMRSVAWSRAFPSELLYPIYVQVLAYDPQFRVAENGVMEKNESDTRYAAEKIVFDWVTVFTVNGPRGSEGHQLTFVNFDWSISTVT